MSYTGILREYFETGQIVNKYELINGQAQANEEYDHYFNGDYNGFVATYKKALDYNNGLIVRDCEIGIKYKTIALNYVIFPEKNESTCTFVCSDSNNIDLFSNKPLSPEAFSKLLYYINSVFKSGKHIKNPEIMVHKVDQLKMTKIELARINHLIIRDDNNNFLLPNITLFYCLYYIQKVKSKNEK